MKRVYEVSLDGKIWAGESLNVITNTINDTLQDPSDFLNQASLYELARGKRLSKYSKGARVRVFEEYSLPSGVVWVPKPRRKVSSTNLYGVHYGDVWYVGPVLSHITKHINANIIEDPRDHLTHQILSSLSTGGKSGKTHKNSVCIKIEEGQDVPEGAVFVQ